VACFLFATWLYLCASVVREWALLMGMDDD